MATTRRRDGAARDSELHALFRAIAADDDEAISRVLAEAPELARMGAVTGATRASAQRFYLAGVGHYVYAGDTALHVAAAGFNGRVARQLIKRGADPNATNRRGATPLHYAAACLPGSSRWNPKTQSAIVDYLIRA